jgi:ubiquinone/menaquinone biosynthesis C-methylase UbiE
MLPLALTIEETFRRAQHKVRVIRFDGTNRRGESYIDPECREAGREYLRFTFSQAAQDISAAVDFVTRDSAGAPDAIVLVTFSLASVEARHALARDKRVSGWVSVVGMADLQSALRTISGGIDYGNGLLKGVRFGRHELVGVMADMDHTGLDAINHQIGFLEDVRRDMYRIEIPITWIHGRYDAWMDLDRVVEVMSCGRTDNRRLIEVPTGHQLRSSRNALATFQLVAEEVSEMAIGKRVPGRTPSLERVSAARRAERGRLPRPRSDVREFWRDYLLGRKRVLGMELLSATAAYRNFMEVQIGLLEPKEGDRIADLGAGTGDFGVSLRSRPKRKALTVVEVDYLQEALHRSRSRRADGSETSPVSFVQCVCNLDLKGGSRICLESEKFDAVLASLVISYLEQPRDLLREVYRILKPGGRLVVSSMLKDADATMLFHDGMIEYATSEARALLGLSRDGDARFDDIIRDFLNDGSRLFDLEEQGRFEFWDAGDLRFAVANAGFVNVEVKRGFGDPAQAVIVSARRS